MEPRWGTGIILICEIKVAFFIYLEFLNIKIAPVIFIYPFEVIECLC